MLVPTVDIARRDGSTVRVRPLAPEDEEELRDLLDGLSVESRWLRFFSAGADLRRVASYMATLDESRGRGLLVVVGEPERIVAHAAFVRETPVRAEVAGVGAGRRAPGDRRARLQPGARLAQGRHRRRRPRADRRSAAGAALPRPRPLTGVSGRTVRPGWRRP